MVKNHLKRLTIPTTWTGIRRKANKYIIRPAAGPHGHELSMPLAVVLKNLGYAKTTKEGKYLLHNNEVLVDGRRVKDTHFPVGLFDSLSFTSIKKSYRMTLDAKGKLALVEDKDNKSKTCRVRDKRVIKGGKVQLGLSDGRTIVVDKTEYKTGDSLIIEVPSQKVSKHLPLKTGANILLTGGKHSGDHVAIAKIEADSLTYKNKEGKEILTARQYAYVIQ